jgi:hypothetical protein
MELGRSWRTLLLMMLLLRPPAARCEVRGHRQQAALKDQRYRAPVNLGGAYFPRAREAEPIDGAPPADRLAPTHDQTDPLWHRLGGGWPTSNFV